MDDAQVAAKVLVPLAVPLACGTVTLALTLFHAQARE
jgi:hypothetical protein